MKKGSEIERKKYAKVMHEFKNGTLEDRWGNKVTSENQAKAIAYSEAVAASHRYAEGGALVGQYKEPPTVTIEFSYEGDYSFGNSKVYDVLVNGRKWVGTHIERTEKRGVVLFHLTTMVDRSLKILEKIETEVV